MGELQPDSGVIEISRGYRIGHLAQHIKFTHECVLEEVCSVLTGERIYEEWKAEAILMGLGFSVDDMLTDPHEFSGGYQVKINLAKLLLAEPDMLLLDEPTNYLDIHSVRWLKQFLRKWDGEVILITHDRDFMDSVVSHILHIYRAGFRKTTGNTQNLYEQIQLEEENYEATRLNEARERKTEDWIKRFKAKATMAKRVQSKIKMLEKQDQKEKLADIESLDFEFNHLPISGNKKLVDVELLSFGYDKSNLFENLSFDISVGDKVCVIGRNGKGKSTLLKLLINSLMPRSGTIKLNPKN